eukprot:UN23347
MRRDSTSYSEPSSKEFHSFAAPQIGEGDVPRDSIVSYSAAKPVGSDLPLPTVGTGLLPPSESSSKSLQTVSSTVEETSPQVKLASEYSDDDSYVNLTDMSSEKGLIIKVEMASFNGHHASDGLSVEKSELEFTASSTTLTSLELLQQSTHIYKEEMKPDSVNRPSFQSVDVSSIASSDDLFEITSKFSERSFNTITT